MKNTGKEHAILYREFCEWCNTVPYLDLDPRLHTHGGRIEDGGYISHRVTAAAFAAWKAARFFPTAPQPHAALDAQRWLDYLIRNQARVCNNLDEYEGDEDCADCGYWLEFTDSNSQRWVQIGVFKTPRDAIDAAIAAAKGE